VLESVLWIRCNFFRLLIKKIFFRIRILWLIFWPEIFLNDASHCFLMCSGTCMTERKKFPILWSVWSAIFHNIFLFYNSIWIRIRAMFSLCSRNECLHSFVQGFVLIASSCIPVYLCRIYYKYDIPDFFVAEHYGLQNTILQVSNDLPSRVFFQRQSDRCSKLQINMI
jgi:hypothetical protein